MDWQPDALAALKKDVPFFVRPAVRKRVEAMASDLFVFQCPVKTRRYSRVKVLHRDAFHVEPYPDPAPLGMLCNWERERVFKGDYDAERSSSSDDDDGEA